MNLKNKKILITGATGGIGNSLVEKFYDSAAIIVATGTNKEKLDNLKKNFLKFTQNNFNYKSMRKQRTLQKKQTVNYKDQKY